MREIWNKQSPEKCLSVSRSQGFFCYSVPKGYAVISKPPTAYTIIHILQNIPHKVIEYLDFACFVYLVFFVNIDLVNEIPHSDSAVYTYFIKTDYEALISLFISLAILSSAVSCDYSLKCDTTVYVIPPISISCECEIFALDVLCFVVFLFK